jgi:hypothetical protein
MQAKRNQCFVTHAGNLKPPLALAKKDALPTIAFTADEHRFKQFQSDGGLKSGHAVFGTSVFPTKGGIRCTALNLGHEPDPIQCFLPNPSLD